MSKDSKMELYKSAVDRIAIDDGAAERIVLNAYAHDGGNEKARKTRKRGGFKLVPALIAAAMTLSVGTVAYAAGNGLLSALFGKEDIEVPDAFTGTINVDNLEIYHDGLSVSPMGFASDGYMTYCMFKLDFEEEIPDAPTQTRWEVDPTIQYYDSSSHDYPWAVGEHLVSDDYEKKMNESKLFKLVNKLREDKTHEFYSFNERFRKVSDHTMYYIYMFSFEDQINGRLDLNTMLTSIWVRGDYDDEIKAYKNFPFINEPLFYADFSIDIQPIEPVRADTSGSEYSDADISVTPCIVRVKFKDKLKSSDERVLRLTSPDYSNCVLLDDGSRIDILGVFGHAKLVSGINTFDMGYAHDYWVVLEYPVNPDSVKSVEIGGNSMPIIR